MAYIDGSALNVVLPTLQKDLRASATDLLWIIDGYLLMLASLIMVSGAIGDKLGRKRVFMAGIALFTVASIACGLAPTSGFLIRARFVQGIGGALMVPGSLALISSLLPLEVQGKSIGTWSAASAIVTAAGPLLGGFLADLGLWRGIFLINVPLGGIALYIQWTKIPESRAEPAGAPIDYPGAILATVGLAGITYSFISMSEYGAVTPTIQLSLLVGILSLAGFFWVQTRSPHPMVPLGLFRSRTFLGANLQTLFLYGALNLLSFFLSLNIVQIQGYSPTVAGFAFLPFIIMMMVLSRWAGSLADRIGPRRPLIVGPTISGFSFLWLSFAGLTRTLPEAFLTFLPPIILFGIGMAITVAPLTAAVMTEVPPKFAGTASGVNNAISRTAGVLAIAIIGALAINLFGHQLARLSARLPLAAETRQELLNEANQLAETTVPPDVPADLYPTVELIIKTAFIEMHRVVMIICAALSWLSALIAYFLIESRRNKKRLVDAPARPQTQEFHL